MPQDPPDELRDWPRWLLRTDHPTVSLVREIISSVLLVVLFGLVLFAISGVWPPLVAVESGSMEPHMHRGDLVFVMEADRLAPSIATGSTGVVTYQTARAAEYQKFGDYGDVIVFEPDGARTPIIHRARFWVNDSENWYAKADATYLDGSSCSAISNCPAPHSGFITKGDNNRRYDQASQIAGPVRPSAVRGTSEVRIPWLGYVRLEFARIRASPVLSGTPGSQVA